MSGPRLDEDALVAAVDLVGRAGAQGFEVGFLHDDVPSAEAAWWAHAQYRGARLAVENQIGPVEAAEALAHRILDGGMCTHCGGLITLTGVGAMFYPNAVSPIPGMAPLTEEQARSRPQCRWIRQGPKWMRGCDQGRPRKPGPARRPKTTPKKRRKR